MSQTRDRLSCEGIISVRQFREVIIPRTIRGDGSIHERSGDDHLSGPLPRISRIVGSIAVAIEAGFHRD